MEKIQATSVVIGDKAILIRGKSGVGKSFLALRLIQNHKANLIADDITGVSVENGILYAEAPKEIAGKIEVRGVGIIEMEFVSHVQIGCVVELQFDKTERIPDAKTTIISDCKIPLFTFDGTFVYNDLQVLAAVRHLQQKDKKC